MRVCMLTTSYPRWRGDLSGNFVESLARSLAERGNHIEVVAPGHRDAVLREETDGIRVNRFRYAIPSRLEVVAYGGGIPHKLKSSNLARAELAQFLISMFRSAGGAARGCDLIHAHWIPTGAVAGLVSRRLNLPMVLTVHGSDGAFLRGTALRKSVSRFSLGSAGHVITVSEALKQDVLEFGGEPGKLSLIHNGVDLEEFRFTQKDAAAERLLWVGRMTEEKGLEFLLRAMKRVASVHREVLLHLVGDGPLRLRLENLSRELGLGGRVVFAGEKGHTQLPGIYASSDVFVLPSMSEGLPVVLLEAMAIGRAVVATRVGGIPELVRHGETGYLVPPGRVDDLAEAIIELLESPDLMSRMGAASRRYVEANHSWDSISDRVYSIYRSLCETDG